MDTTEKSIIKTMSFYDLLGKPLMLEEIWHNLYQRKAGKLQVLVGLKRLLAKKIINKNISILSGNIYYSLFGREKIVQEYFQNFKVSRERFKKVNRTIQLLKYVPFVKNISVINSLALNNSREASDIDILIITKRGKLWTARAFTVLFLELIGQNKNKWYNAGKFCLGFAFDESNLDLKTIKFTKDIDFTYWLANLTPVYDRGIYKNLIEQNPWVKEELPNWEKKSYKAETTKKYALEKFLSGQIGEKLEKWLAKIQINRILNDPENHRKGASVIANQSMMKLHAYDVREQRQMEWESLTKKLFKL